MVAPGTRVFCVPAKTRPYCLDHKKILPFWTEQDLLINRQEPKPLTTKADICRSTSIAAVTCLMGRL